MELPKKEIDAFLGQSPLYGSGSSFSYNISYGRMGEDIIEGELIIDPEEKYCVFSVNDSTESMFEGRIEYERIEFNSSALNEERGISIKGKFGHVFISKTGENFRVWFYVGEYQSKT